SAAGKVTKISVAVGDQVSEGMVLIELESDTDADSEIESDSDSQITNADTQNKTDAAADKQSEAQDNQQADTNPAEENTSQPANQAGEQAGKATTHALPDLGVDEAQVSEIMVSVGDMVTADQSILLIESDKASVEVPAPEAGKVEKILVQAGDMVANGQDFIVIIGEGSESGSNNARSEERRVGKEQRRRGATRQ